MECLVNPSISLRSGLSSLGILTPGLANARASLRLLPSDRAQVNLRAQGHRLQGGAVAEEDGNRLPQGRRILRAYYNGRPPPRRRLRDRRRKGFRRPLQKAPSLRDGGGESFEKAAKQLVLANARAAPSNPAPRFARRS